ncbi:retrotransposon protein, putative, ty3-gypsy subclass [Tanacetum coccineum]
MNEKGIDSSKSKVIKEESKEEVKEESKEEESTRKRKLGTRKKMKSRKRRYNQNTSEDDSDKENDELRLHLTIALDEEKEVDYEILDRKYPIKEWKTKCLGTKPQDDEAEHFEEINQNVSLYKLEMDRYQDEIPEGFDRVLWGDLMVMFNPDDETELWNTQQYWNIVSWQLHFLQSTYLIDWRHELVNHMLVSKKYPFEKKVCANAEIKVRAEEYSTRALECCCVAEKTVAAEEGKEFKRSRDNKVSASDEDSASDCDTLVHLYVVVDWELLPTGLGSINAIYKLDNSRKYFTSLREILHLVTRADLMMIYGRVMTFYQDKKAEGVGLVLWGDLKILMIHLNVVDIVDWFLHMFVDQEVLPSLSTLIERCSIISWRFVIEIVIGIKSQGNNTTVDQGMSVEEIDGKIAERVANANEANAIYRRKTNMARKSISQTDTTRMQGSKNANNKESGKKSQWDNVLGKNKRKFENTSRNSQNQQQQQTKRQNTGRAYTAGSGDKKPYGGSRPLCLKCNYHHDGPCAPKCYKCNKYGHIARDCRGTGNANAVNNQRVTVTSQKIICYECGNQGHYKRDCPERKNQSHKNQIEGTRAHGVVHTLRGGETDQGPNNIKDGIEA